MSHVNYYVLRNDHVLFCAPTLGRSHVAYPEIGGRVASAFPIFDCEIGDADTEVLVLVFRPTDDVEWFLGQLSVADEGSWLEVRNYRGEIKQFTPESVPTYPVMTAFLGAAAPV